MLMIRTIAPLAVLALAALPSRPDASRCHGNVTGAVTAEFECVADVTSDAGQPVFAIVPRTVLPDVPVYKPGAFRLPAAPTARTYTLADLGMGMASLAVENGALYTATKTSSQRGEVTLTFRTAGRDPRRPDAWIVHGSYRARLVPTTSDKTGEVVFEVSF